MKKLIVIVIAVLAIAGIAITAVSMPDHRFGD